MTFAEFSNRYESTILVLKKPATVVTIHNHLRGFCEFFGSWELSDLDYPRLQKYFSALSQTRSPKTVRNLWSSLRLVLNQAKREGLIKEVPEIQLPKCRWAVQPCFSLEELKVFASYDPLYALLAETGLRIGEALAVRFADIDYKTKTLTVARSLFQNQEQVPKTDSSLRTICISSRLRNILAQPGSENSQLFPTPVTTALARLHKLQKNLCLKPCGFHAFRRGNITALYNLGMPEAVLARRAGHRMAGMTLGVYCQIGELADRPWAEKIGRLLHPPTAN